MATEKRLIDVDKLIEHLNRCIEQSKGLMRSVCVAIKCFVEQMPTVDAVEVVHGRWEDGRQWTNSRWKVCSICHNSAPEPHGGYEYCPNCGAKMDLEVCK